MSGCVIVKQPPRTCSTSGPHQQTVKCFPHWCVEEPLKYVNNDVSAGSFKASGWARHLRVVRGEEEWISTSSLRCSQSLCLEGASLVGIKGNHADCQMTKSTQDITIIIIWNVKLLRVRLIFPHIFLKLLQKQSFLIPMKLQIPDRDKIHTDVTVRNWI